MGIGEAVVDEIIDYRYINQLPMIVTTNKRIGDLPTRIADRLSEGITLVLHGDSYRRGKDETVLPG